MIKGWDELTFFDTGEWQVLEERFYDLDQQGVSYNPPRDCMFSAIDLCPFDATKVCIIGQDPYPGKEYATGTAFSIPYGSKKFPPTLVNIFKEYCDDLHYPMPVHGDLTPWCKQGVLLWNARPSCFTDKPASHRDWIEWDYLNHEIVDNLAQKDNVVFVTLGEQAKKVCWKNMPESMGSAIARSRQKNVYLHYPHPSPLSASRGFLGSRMFSTINDKLCGLGQQPVDWRLE